MEIKRLFILSLFITLISCGGGNGNNGLTPVELIPISSGNEYGYIDWEGKIVINPQFSEAGLFYDGIALVKTTGEDSRYGYIDTKGKYIIQPEFIEATNFSDGIAVTVKRNEAPKGINKKGETLFELKNVQTIREFREGLAAFSVENEEGKIRWGFIDKKGKTVIEPQFIYVSSFSEGKCGIGDEKDKWGYIDTKGKIIINPQFEYVDPFRDGKAVVYERREKVGVIDEKGEYLINPQFQQMIPDGEGYLIKSSYSYGWADKKGTIIINPQFEDAQPFGGNKLAPVRKARQWGYIDKEGKFIINPQFDRAFPLLNGKAIVENKNVGIIDKKGKYLVNPQFDGLGSDYSNNIIACFREVKKVNSDYLDIGAIANQIKKEITPTSLSGIDFSTSMSEMLKKFGLQQNRYYYSDLNLFSDKRIGKGISLSLRANGNFRKQVGWSSIVNPDATAEEFNYTINLSGKANGKDEDLLRSLETVFKGFEKIAAPDQGKVQYKNDKFLVTCDSDSYQITLKIIPAAKAVVQTSPAGGEKPVIDPKWVTLPTDKEFRWMKWEDTPEAIKEATKHAKVGDKNTLNDDIQGYLKGYGDSQGGCNVKIALIDLNENGIYGFAISAVGNFCCGTLGCSLTFIEDGGLLYATYGTGDGAIPMRNGIIATSTGKEFPFKSDNKISSQTKYQLREYFRYK